MQAGEKLSYQGSQVCLFPLDILNCTQVSTPDSYSHCCGHPADWIGTYYDYPIYAPCDCHLVHTYPDGNSRVYTSDAPIWTPSGLSYVSFMFTHDENPPAATSFSQGDLIAHTGTAGQYVTGDHSHIDQTFVQDAQLVYYGVTCAGGNPCYALSGSEYPYDVFYLSGSETIVQTLGQTFETWDKPPEPIGSKAKYAILFLAKKRKEEKDHGRVKRYSRIV